VIKEEDAGKAVNEILNDPSTEQEEFLLCVHGHGIEPHRWIEYVQEAQTLSKNIF